MFAPGEVVTAGDVALHDDGDPHWAIVLTVEADECEALFFTSSPTWAEQCRRATQDELAMAGYISTKPTYLAYVVRPCWDFVPIEGRRYPSHWVEALRQEFCVVQRVRQVSGT